MIKSLPLFIKIIPIWHDKWPVYWRDSL